MPRAATKARRAAPSRSEIVEAAVRIADAEDLGALTMRRLANDLGLPPMTLYGHFANKDEILDAMGDSVMGGFEPPPTRAGDAPRETFLRVTEAFLALLHQHPCVARLLTMRVTDSPGALDGAMEKILDRFLEVGMQPEEAVRAYGAMMTFSLGSVLYRLPRPWGQDDDAAVEARADRASFYRSLDPRRFVRLHQLSDLLPQLAAPDQARAQLEMLADGFAAGH